MGKATFSDDFKRDAALQITERGRTGMGQAGESSMTGHRDGRTTAGHRPFYVSRPWNIQFRHRSAGALRIAGSLACPYTRFPFVPFWG